MKGPLVAIVGSSDCTPQEAAWAAAFGRLIAERGGVLICGGLGGVMEAAARGAKAAGGLTIGILPGNDAADANASTPVVGLHDAFTEAIAIHRVGRPEEAVAWALEQTGRQEV